MTVRQPYSVFREKILVLTRNTGGNLMIIIIMIIVTMAIFTFTFHDPSCLHSLVQ